MDQNSYIKTQKIIKVGNSLAITLDKNFSNQAGFKIGEAVVSVYNPHSQVISLAKTKTALNDKKTTERQAIVSSKITYELIDWTNKFIKKYDKALKVLADA